MLGFATGSASRRSPLPTSAATAQLSCSSICSNLTRFNDWDVTPMTCTQLTAGTTVKTPTGQSTVGCAANFTTKVDLCQVTLDVKTSGTAHTYMEVWLPNGNSSSWNGRTMSTDNGGLNGCVHYVDMAYVSGLGFAAIGDNAGHNGSSFDGTWTMKNNEAIVDWAWRARHASVDVGKQVVNKFYGEKPDYSYYIGCSAGGAQGMQSAQKFPNDFDGIISGAAANGFNHLQDWNAHFYQLTGGPGNDTFLTLVQWKLVQSYILDQCDEKLDGVDDGILEDPTICDFDASAIPVCNSGETNSTTCLTATQIETVKDVFKPVYNGKDLIYPPLLYGAQVDAFRLGLLSGTSQGIPRDFFRGAVYNDSSFDIAKLSEADYTKADQLDDLHGNPSAFNADLSAFQAAGKKLLVYHGMADPMTSGYNSQRYYQKVAKTMGLGNTEIDNFMRFFRISGMAHCGVGGISGAGAWMFGQSAAASPATNNIVSNLVNWVEKNEAPETLLGTKFWYDTPSMGIEFERRHCRFPYRTVYKSGDSSKPDSWGCEFIDDWQSCEGVTCNTDGTFT
ncbi:putative ferulic acid Esterase/Feruloyl esterase precursor [Teratosphaeria nubilosa]|uniref:Carboxylic ester hydrolase n=1 Tax=Teratosphaeria nubilosa TaxID=161662 RepID=A0A6G1L7H7_9PEZI|nr:putative ferulic acid Esterase/Feruloyl esterase precursor [Teratosphaeria nubilosa]